MNDSVNASLTDLFRQIIETQNILRRELNSVEGSLRSLILTSAQTNAELALHRRSIDQMHNKITRLTALSTDGARRPDWGSEPERSQR